MAANCTLAGICANCGCHDCRYGNHCRLHGNGCHLACTAPPRRRR